MVVAVTVGGGGVTTMTMPQMNSHGLRSLTKSATKSKYLRLCTQGSVWLSSYTNYV
jgi:hypothetical protein